MIYRKYGKTDVKLSVIALGGHEFYGDGRIKGFADSKESVTAGYIQKGFGEENRREIVFKALDLGINIFDVTIDPEIEAIGRLLEKTSEEVFIQTRPQGMVYKYDRANRKMADYAEIKKEVVRILSMLRRDTLDILNFAFMQEALDDDPEYMYKIGDNISKLKKEGLIRFANADTFSGTDVYMQQIKSGHFDSVFINYNYKDCATMNVIAKAAEKNGMGVFCRELFMKGGLFKAANEMGIKDKSEVAKITLKWILNEPNITSIMVGVADALQLEANARVLDDIRIAESGKKILNALMNNPVFLEQ